MASHQVFWLDWIFSLEDSYSWALQGEHFLDWLNGSTSANGGVEQRRGWSVNGGHTQRRGDGKCGKSCWSPPKWGRRGSQFLGQTSSFCVVICAFALIVDLPWWQICESFNPMTELNQVLNLYLVQKLFDRWYLICEVKQKTHLSERIDPTFCKQPQGFICRQGYPLCVTIKILARSNPSPLEGGSGWWGWAVWISGVLVVYKSLYLEIEGLNSLTV